MNNDTEQITDVSDVMIMCLSNNAWLNKDPSRNNNIIIIHIDCLK